MPRSPRYPRSRTGGELVVAALLAHGVPRAFGVPGESYLPVLDALYEQREHIAFITCRHEHGAAMMAEAHGKLTGKPAVCLVTRGPGACNAAIGVHTAFQDSTPMLLLVGQVKRRLLGREAFQEVDFERMFAPLAKHVEQVDTAADIPAAMARAFHIAGCGRQGPVVLALPEDVLTDCCEAEDVPALPLDRKAPDPHLMLRLHEMLAGSARPILLLGGSGWTEQARADILAFAERNALPVCCGFRRHDLFENDHPCFVGEVGVGANPALVARIQAADLVLAVGTRLDEATSQGYRLFSAEGPRLVHVHPDPAELGRVFPTVLSIAADVAEFTAMARGMPPVGHGWRNWSQAARADFLADTEPARSIAELDPGQMMKGLRDLLPNDALMTVDAGNFSGWPQRYLRFGGGRRLLGAANGAMGYAVPAAVAAKLCCPQRMVVACVGDGGFGMTGGELATAMASAAAPLVLIFDNGMYGTIRMHQEREYPARTLGTALTNPDFAALARAYGAYAERVERTEGFAPAFQRAIDAGRPAVLHLRLDAELISTRTTLSRLRSG